MLATTQARVLLAWDWFLERSLLAVLGEACGPPAGERPYEHLPELRAVVTLDERPAGERPASERPAPAVQRPGLLALSDLTAGGAGVSPEAAQRRALAVRPGDLCEILSTSGTTGTPKGVMLDHAQILRGYWDWSDVVTLAEGDRYPVIAPFSHGFGINAGLLACVLRAATLIPVPSSTPRRSWN